MFRPLIVLAGVLALASAHADDVHLSKFDVLDVFDVLDTADDAADASADGVAAKSDGSRQLSFAASGKVWNLELTRNSRLEAQLNAPSTQLYRGNVAGRNGSWLRLSERGGVLRGLIFDGNDFYAIEPAEAHGAATGGQSMVFYALADMVVDAGQMTCGSQPMFGSARQSDANRMAKAIAEELEFVAEEVASQRIDMTVIGDSMFADRHSLDPTGALVDRLNIIDGIFSDQVGVTLNVTEYRITSAADEPFTTNDASDLLDEVGALKLSDPALRSQGLVHLYTGRNLDGTTAGIAFRGALCSARFGVGLSEGRRNLTTDSLIGAHELGHNFGAPHDDEAGSACEATGGGFLMAPSINGSSTFSTCSLSEIQTEVSSASCLAAIVPIDVLPIGRNFPAMVSAGNTFTGRVDVSNNGSDAASNVTLTVTPPAVTTMQNLPAGCSASGSGASCNIASLSGGATVSLNFDFTAGGSGDQEIAIETIAAGDANAANDETSVTVTVQPTVDLGVALQGPATLPMGDSATVTATVSNLSTEPAANAELVITVPAALSIDSVANACTAAGQTVTCRQASVTAGANVDFDIVVEALSLGQATVSAALSADDPDPNAANNSATFNVMVIDPTTDADVSVDVSGTTSLNTDQSASYTLTVANLGPATATAIDVTVSVPALLSVTSIGNTTDCTLAGNDISCTFANINNGDNVTVQINADGTSAGTATIDATVTPGSPDPAAANNTDALSVTLSTPPTSNNNGNGGGDSGGGGGTTGWPWLISLAGLIVVRRRARR